MLEEISIPTLPADAVLPRDILRFISMAEERVEEYQEALGEQMSTCFEPADYTEMAEAMLALHDNVLPRGSLFCEWGSGMGVVAGLADLLGWEAWGIECDALLCDQAELFRAETGLRTRLLRGDFGHAEPGGQAGARPERFDLIYAYPWPKEVESTQAHFERVAKDGAYLLLFLGFGELALFRKSG